MLGMYVTYIVSVIIGVDPLLALVVSVLVNMGVGLFFERVLIERIADKEKFFQLIVTLALGLVIENVIITIFGNEILAVPRRMGSLTILSTALEIGPVRMSYSKLLPLPVAAVLTVVLHYFLTRTRVGLGIRSIAQNDMGALLSGVNIKQAYFLTWGVGCAFMGLSGALLSLFQALYPAIGREFVIICFLAVVLGGAGSYVGSFASAIIIGVIESVSSFVFFPAIRQIFYLALFVLVLLFIPGGLFPTRVVVRK